MLRFEVIINKKFYLMKSTQYIKIAGGFSFFFFLFHIPFYWILGWKQTLSCLNPDDWAIVMCFNIISIALLFLMGFVSLFQAEDVATTKLGKSFLIFSAWFYYFRIVAEFVFFNEPNWIISAFIIVLCLVPGVLYSLPLFFHKKS